MKLKFLSAGPLNSNSKLGFLTAPDDLVIAWSTSIFTPNAPIAWAIAWTDVTLLKPLLSSAVLTSFKRSLDIFPVELKICLFEWHLKIYFGEKQRVILNLYQSGNTTACWMLQNNWLDVQFHLLGNVFGKLTFQMVFNVLQTVA